MTGKTTIDHLKIQGIDVLPLIKAVANGMEYDPGHSDLDDEQPVHVVIPLGEYRRAVRLLHELEKAQ